MPTPGIGGVIQGYRSNVGQPSIFDIYGNAVQQQTGNYSDIMNQLGNSIGKGINYQTSPDVSSALGMGKNFAETGGYSPSDIGMMRERGISPIRAIYANAQRNLDRNRALSGGYSPNYGAVSAKMARDLSQQIGDQVTNVNAQLAQSIAQNKMQGLGMYGSMAGQEEGRGIDVSKFNLQQPLNVMNAMTSLYGTSPAMAGTFGNQALESQRINQQGNQFNQRLAADVMGQALPSLTQPPPFIGRGGPAPVIGRYGSGDAANKQYFSQNSWATS